MQFRTIVVGATLLLGPTFNGSLHAQAVRSTVTGTVFDSIAGRPLSGARVQLASTTRTTWERSVSTDAMGRFRFDSVAVDSYLISFSDAAADTLGLEPPLKKVDVRDANEVRVALAIPSTHSIIAFNCRGQSDDDGLFLGVVRASSDRAPIAGAKVRAQWIEMGFGSKGLERRTPHADVTSDANGNFALCGIPADASSTIQVRAWSGRDSSGFVDLDVPRNRMLRRDMYIGKAIPDSVMARTGPNSTSTIALPIFRGNGSLRGTIISEKGRPIPNAHISLGGSGNETKSGPNGEFTMTGLPSGTYAVESRAIGFVSTSSVVDITGDGPASVKLVALTQDRLLDTVRVLGQRPSNSAFDGFERRREQALGQFLTEDQIKERHPLVSSDLFRSMRGVFVSLGSGVGLQYKVEMRAPTMGGRCTPSVFVDRMPLLGDIEDVDRIITARDIVAVEVYNDWANSPAEYQSGKYCGSIVMWTRVGARR